MTPTPTNARKTSHPLTRSATRWTTRLFTAVLLASAGLTATATQAPAPVAASWRDDTAVPPAVDSRRDALVAVLKSASVSSPAGGSSLLEVSPGLDVPAPAVRAYRFAETVMRTADPACRLDWSLLAAIGDVESDHGRYGGAEVRPDGTSAPHILGPRLDGGGEVAAIADTDDGDVDGDRRWDRAVGPMQFIPSTWALVGADADGDEVRDPHDVDDAALATAVYLCAGDADLSITADRKDAVYRYNHSASYVALVLRLAAAYAEDAFSLTEPQPTVRAGSHAVDVPSLRRPIEVGAHPAQSAGRSLGVQASARAGVADSSRRRTGSTGQSPGASSSPRSTEGATRDGTASGTTRGNDGQTSSVSRDGSGDAGTAGGGRTGSGDGTSSGPTGGSDSGGTAGDGTASRTPERSDGSDGSGSGSTDGGSTGGGSTDGSGGGSTDGSGGGSTDGSDGSGGGSTDGSDGSGGGSTDGSDGSGGGSTDGSPDGDDGTGDGDTAEQGSSKSLSGELTRDDGGSWFVDGTAVDFGDDAYLAAEALNDFDGMDGVESNNGELETLVHKDVSVVLEGDVVQELNGMAYR